MRSWISLIATLLATSTLVNAGEETILARADLQSQCAAYGFRPGTDGFSNCMMQLDREIKRPAKSHEDVVRQYRELSQKRQGDDQYPVCSASNMNAELDIETGKWVGDDCQLAP